MPPPPSLSHQDVPCSQGWDGARMPRDILKRLGEGRAMSALAGGVGGMRTLLPPHRFPTVPSKGGWRCPGSEVPARRDSCPPRALQAFHVHRQSTPPVRASSFVSTPSSPKSLLPSSSSHDLTVGSPESPLTSLGHPRPTKALARNEQKEREENPGEKDLHQHPCLEEAMGFSKQDETRAK